ncbi:MAG: branched-chain amino acid transaminase [Sediminibacterium sp.]|jgi:branched-chain amino acid aminotransferase|nr:branched-chain amino acid transaminase [uncultured Sediminibacterium sp.]
MYYGESTVLYFNGEFLNAKDAKIDLYSQSLHYGYAVFEGIRSYKTENGTKIFKAKEHYDRLRYSAEVMGIPFETSTDTLTELTYEVLRLNNFSDAYIRPVVLCSPNMSLSKGKESYLTITAWEWTNGYLSNQMRIMTSSYRRPNPSGFKINAKVSGHYVNSILACQEAKDNGYDEALLLDIEGNVAEGPGANVFFEKDGVLYTPAAGNILPGITRATVLELCQELQIPVQEKKCSPEEMRGADSAFYCGTAAEVVALESMDGVHFKQPWENSYGSLLQQAYKAKVLEKSFTRETVEA